MQALIDSYPNSMLSVDKNYLYTAFNRNYAQTMFAAYGAHIEIGHNLLDYITSPKDREKTKQNLDRALTGEIFSESAYYVQSSGSKIFIDIRHIPIKDENGDCVGVSVFSEEVTELTESREILKDTQTLYRNLYENINSAILIIDPESTSIVDANPAACSFYGYSHAELTKLHVSDLVDLSPNEINILMDQVTNGTSSHFIHTNRLANGETREVDVFSSSIQVNKKVLHIAIIKDITARKKIETELRLSEERYRTQFKNLPIPTYTWKHQGDDFILIDYNHEAEIITEGQISEIIGKTISELYPENPQVISDISTCFKDQKVIHRELQIPLRSTGLIRDLKVTYVYVPSDFVLVHTEDVTDKKQAEKDLLASENHYRSVISSMAEGIVVHDANGEIITCNTSAETILGLSADQMKGKTPLDPQWSTIHEDGSPFPGETHPASISLQTGKPCKNVVMGVKSPNGELHWILVNSMPVFLENESRPNTVIATFTDITESKLTEYKIREAEEKFSTVFHASQDPISISRISDGTYLDVNDAFCRMSGIPREKFIGHTGEELNFSVDPHKRKLLFQKLIQDGQVQGLEAEYKSQAGKIGTILISGCMITINKEKCILIIGRDITKLKEVEAQLVAARDQLEQRVQERTAQLEAAITSLERAAKVKDEFLAEVSHELRTPLNGILGFSESLQLAVYGELNEKQGHAIEAIESNGEHLLKLINTILDYSKIQSNILTKNLAPLSLAEACLSALNAVAASAEKKHLQASFLINPQDILMQMDEQRLHQILHNLLSNAVKFTPENGKFGIEVTGDKQNKQVKIVIWDQGIGLKKEDQARIFHPFVQADSSLARTYEGIGLGLAVTKQLTELFGGNIRVESTFGEGSRFIVTLPWIDNFQSSST